MFPDKSLSCLRCPLSAVCTARCLCAAQVAKINNETVMTGVPMMRPMFLEFPQDAECYDQKVEAQFMLGPDWLIAPVTAENATSWQVRMNKTGLFCAPLFTEIKQNICQDRLGTNTRKTQKRPVCSQAYLPKIPVEPSGTPGETSHEWVYWWNQTVVAESQWVTVDTSSLKDFPLFYKRPK
jgi:hypothetical protein